MRTVAFALAAILGLVAAATVYGQAGTKPDPKAEALKKLHAPLKSYWEATKEMPADLMVLYRQAFVDDPLIFFLPGTAEHETAKKFPERATPSFRVIAKTWSGDIADCGPFGDGETYVLSADGSVRRTTSNVAETYGRWKPLPFTTEVSDEELGQSWARLGVTLAEVDVDPAGKAVLVKAVIPGYQSGYRHLLRSETYLRPGDRILAMNGQTVGDLRAVDRILAPVRAIDDMKLRILRAGKILETEPLRPLIELSFPGLPARFKDPKQLAKLARAHLDPRGQGSLGIRHTTDPQGLRITEVRPRSAAESAGLRVGDRIRQVEGNPIQDPSDLGPLMSMYPAGTTIEVGYERAGVERTASVKLDRRDSTSTYWLRLDSIRFAIHASQYNVDAAMKYAELGPPGNVVHLLEGARGQEAALRWIDGALRPPPPSDVARSILYRTGLPAAHRARAELLDRMGRWQDAVNALLEEAKLERDLAGSRTPIEESYSFKLIWELLLRHKQYDQAIAYFKRCRYTEFDRRKELEMFDLADALRQAGRTNDARSFYQEIAKSEKFGDLARKALADLER